MNNKKNPIISNILAIQVGPGAYRITWSIQPEGTPVTLFSSYDPAALPESGPPGLKTDQNSALVENLEPARRVYFCLVPDLGHGVWVATRRVLMEKTYNFRDIGGYPTIDGRKVRWGRVFRSDALSRLTDSGRITLAGLGIRSVIDLRTENERSRAPDLIPVDGSIESIHFPIQSGALDYTEAKQRLDAGDESWLTPDFMTKAYLFLVDQCPDVWGRVIQWLRDPEHLPAVVHCTGGKDRAGTAAAMILLALGVDRPWVIADHQLSNEYIFQGLWPEITIRLRSQGIDPEKLKPYFLAPKNAMEALLDRLGENGRTPEEYLIQKGGVEPSDLEALRDLLLEE